MSEKKGENTERKHSLCSLTVCNCLNVRPRRRRLDAEATTVAVVPTQQLFPVSGPCILNGTSHHPNAGTHSHLEPHVCSSKLCYR